MSLCKYKNALGEPNKGIHSYRFLGLAIIDVIMTVVSAFIISYFTKFSFYYILGGLFLSGIILHRLFCVRTRIDTIIFPNARD